jgi:hypothetical protein
MAPTACWTVPTLPVMLNHPPTPETSPSPSSREAAAPTQSAALLEASSRVQDPVPCEKPPSGAGQSPSMAPQRTGAVAIIAKAKPSGGNLLADPDSGLIDGDPALARTPSMKRGIGLLRASKVVFGTGLPPEPQLQLRPASFRHTPSAVQPEQNEMRAGAKC